MENWQMDYLNNALKFNSKSLASLITLSLNIIAYF